MADDEIQAYHAALSPEDQAICAILRREIDTALPDAESKVWHAHPVWFLQGNPLVGYSRQKPGIRLMFWSGADFGEQALDVIGAKFKDASIFYTSAAAINADHLQGWLKKARAIQWDYKNLMKNKGLLRRL